MDEQIVEMSLLIFGARTVEVTLGALRTVSVVQGRRGMAWVLGFLEVLIWVFAVSTLVQHIHQPFLAIAYAFGFATGNYCGVTIERWLALGTQVIRIATRQASSLEKALQQMGTPIFVFRGSCAGAAVQLLLLETSRKAVASVLQLARSVDPQCQYTVEEVRITSQRSP